MLTETVATALGTKLGDLGGRKTLFMVSIVIFVGASALAGASESMTWLIIVRAIQGLGGGGLTVTATAMIADIIPLRDRGKYLGALGAVFGVTTAGPGLRSRVCLHLDRTSPEPRPRPARRPSPTWRPSGAGSRPRS